VCPNNAQELQSKLHLPLIEKPIEFYHISKASEILDKLEELRNLAIKEIKGNGKIENTIPSQTDSSYNHPLKLQKLNIWTEEQSKISLVGDYWDEQTTQEIQSLLQEYEDLFQNTFLELKGIKGVMGEMKIELKPGSKPVRHRPYHINPRIKLKVKKEINNMLEVGLIFLVEEEEWVSLIVIQSKKDTKDIRVYIDYRSLNSSCVHDSFSTPFTVEVLEQVVG
jgi:DNA integrity scanning protein DisA with diadenylate cyclase activity